MSMLFKQRINIAAISIYISYEELVLNILFFIFSQYLGSCRSCTFDKMLITDQVIHP